MVITTAWDVLARPEALEHMRQLSSDPDFNREFFQLLDLTRVTETREEKIFLPELCRPHVFSRRSRRAIVVGALGAIGGAIAGRRMIASGRKLLVAGEEAALLKAAGRVAEAGAEAMPEKLLAWPSKSELIGVHPVRACH